MGQPGTLESDATQAGDPPSGDARLRALCDEALAWSLPGGGRTAERLDRLAAVAAADLVRGRLVEAHTDAVAICAELGGPPPRAGELWGVWAAGPAHSVVARPAGVTWHLEGSKGWCSAAGLATHALVDAETERGQVLFAVDLAQPGVHRGPAEWSGPGMRRADTRAVSFDHVRAEPVGGPGDYLSRPGFWAGAVGVAACWHGGTVAAARTLLRRDGEDPHLLAHLGAVHTALSAGRAVLADAAQRLDAAPGADHFALATAVRTAVERQAAEVIDRVGRALGPGPLAHDAAHARLIVDLTVYVRQHHAERDLAGLGARLREEAPWWG